ncbi:hypothetical protein ANANG_G00253910 [Anguilla anguilla]|uniref:Uncharacterized protein n=1 Tax=Anguilla anguilla TaxID=7936 RepID=A0A9D3RN37_ANGAN|nr:hypothetical protein ANANG_G00253910 [Anguilla anguilla]
MPFPVVCCRFLSPQSDPLGLNAAPASGEGAGDPSLGNGQRKRRLSEEAPQGTPNSFKRPKVEAMPVTPTTPTVPISPSTPGAKPWSSGTEDKQAPAPPRLPPRPPTALQRCTGTWTCRPTR